MNYDDIDLQTILKRFALWGGIALAIVSIYFSYDGADQSISGGNPEYTDIAKAIMVVMAVVVTLAQFIFNSDFAKLSSTMRLIGVISYVYSLTTNYMGINHLFGFEGLVGGGISAFMDIAPEAFIAWALDDSLQGDMIGNIMKIVTGTGNRRKGSKPNHETARNFPYTQNQLSKKEQARMRFERGRGDTNPSHPFENFGEKK